MIRIELDDFSIVVPVKSEMHVNEFLAIAEKLERIAGKAHSEKKPYVPPPKQEAQAFMQPPEPLAPPMPPEEVRKATPVTAEIHEEEMHVAHLMNHLKAQTEHIKKTEERLEKHEEHIVQILQYLQSLDKHIRR
jgi:hypothetical protein